MSILIGVGVVTTVSVFYLGRKGWYALHRMVGITPGVLTYQDSNAPLLLTSLNWQQLDLNKKHLEVLSDKQLRQLQNIDKKVADYHNYQNELEAQNVTSAINEQQFVLHKMLHTRLPEMLVSHYHLANINISNRTKNGQTQAEAGRLLQEILDNIEQRLDGVLERMEEQHLQELRVMKNYIHSHDD
ncbi:hypothetical protein CXF58_06015 [Psychrobacter sp. Sarcosine-02u-2]|uniref:hypothetical protein n=1 Tax=Psychrobacter sp. Sarcosine-02u-2 TaxID=2058324 RepID=UPI000C7E737A|nr:hypothetical protein [Psychrobacter sp. Sarcosine-02u-2]PKG86103.1 hypothetical protein CXF58_06015 [Psychrobacter sp. Sarcosine-02u-2]